MNSFDDAYEDVELTVGGRRKRADPTSNKREVAKRMRHSGGGQVPMVACSHEASSGICCAEFLTAHDRALNFEKFYASVNKVQQDAYLLRLMHISDAKRKRVSEDKRKQARAVSTTYYLLTSNGQGRVRVCKATFCSILGISLDRVTRVAKYFQTRQSARPENRGGHRQSDVNEQKRDAVIRHIKQFKCRPSHYSRKDSPGRKYLPSDLSVAKMFRMFKEQNEQQISYSLYYSIFTRSFNLGFGHPASDVCSTCTQFRNEVRDPMIEERAKKELAAKFILHRRQARQFYDSLNNVNNTITICFDVMENLVLPRTPIGQAYYSRQLYMYIFGVVIHRADHSQKKEDIHLFTWLESENKKDSNMIASALRFFLQDVHKEELSDHQELRLFSDSCYGQNKNLNMMAMLLALRNQVYPNLRITYTFPVRGHSFLPADRVFGRIEQEIQKQGTVLLPEEYLSIMEHHGTVHRYREQWQSFDFKQEVSSFLKKSRSFKLSEAKMVEINGSGIGIKASYSGEFAAHSVLKKGKRWDQFQPQVLPLSSQVKPAKKADVLKLLEELSAPAHVMEFYAQQLAGNAIASASNPTEESEEGSDIE